MVEGRGSCQHGVDASVLGRDIVAMSPHPGLLWCCVCRWFLVAWQLHSFVVLHMHVLLHQGWYLVAVGLEGCCFFSVRCFWHHV